MFMVIFLFLFFCFWVGAWESHSVVQGSLEFIVYPTLALFS